MQYRETDFNFVSRLMEQEGIYYYFRHTDGHNTVVLTDSTASTRRRPATRRFRSSHPSRSCGRSSSTSAAGTSRARSSPASTCTTTTTLERPSVELKTRKVLSRTYTPSDYEIYDYPGHYLQKARRRAVRGRADRRVRQPVRDRAGGDQRKGVWPSAPCSRSTSLRATIRTASISIRGGRATTSSSATTRRCRRARARATGAASSRCRASSSSGRSAATPKPFVQGPQTAVVVGPGGDEIYTDKYGRVKVQFHWDRYGKKDENSSCWIRVSHPWAGKGWGAVSTPRIGQEVIVDFLEGDPDQPIITGRVYNAEKMPPFALPAEKTQSIIRDHGANEIIMEGDAGKQRITMYSPHAETKFSMGAPNSPVAGFFFKTDQQWDEYVKANKQQVVDGNKKEVINGDSHSHTVGTVDASVLGNSKYYLKGNYICQVDGHQEYSTYGHYLTKVLGFNTVIIIGADTDLYLSAQQVLNVGTLISIFKNLRYENSNGDIFRTPLKKYMAAKEKQQVAEAMQAFGERREKVAGLLMSKAANLHQEAGEMKLISKGLANIKAAAWELKAKKMKWEGSRMLAKGKKKFEGGVLEVNNALKCST